MQHCKSFGQPCCLKDWNLSPESSNNYPQPVKSCSIVFFNVLKSVRWSLVIFAGFFCCISGHHTVWFLSRCSILGRLAAVLFYYSFYLWIFFLTVERHGSNAGIALSLLPNWWSGTVASLWCLVLSCYLGMALTHTCLLPITKLAKFLILQRCANNQSICSTHCSAQAVMVRGCLKEPLIQLSMSLWVCCCGKCAVGFHMDRMGSSAGVHLPFNGHVLWKRFVFDQISHHPLPPCWHNLIRRN